MNIGLGEDIGTTGAASGVNTPAADNVLDLMHGHAQPARYYTNGWDIRDRSHYIYPQKLSARCPMLHTPKSPAVGLCSTCGDRGGDKRATS